MLDATGKGIGCQSGTRKFKGPREPKDPPWPPGAKPTPSPAPTASADPFADPFADPGVDPGASADPAASEPGSVDPDDSAEPLAQSRTRLLASTGIRIAQAEPAPDSTPTPISGGEVDAEIAPDVTSAPEPARRSGRSRLLPGIDVSHHNGDIDYGKVREAGNRFVFIKATQDNAFIDPMFPTNMARARAAGLAAGGYHFFDYTLDGKTQADHFVDRLEAGNGLDGALPPVVDVECWGPIGTSTHVVAEARLRDFVARLYERTGRLPILYTSVFMWKQVMGNAEGFEGLPLWAACWGCAAPPSLAPGWDEWAFWQTGVNRVPGVGRLDGNYFSGSKKDLNALKLRPLALAGGADATRGQRVEVDLGGRDARQIRTSLDGEQWTAWNPVRSQVHAELGPEEGEHTVHVQLRAGPGLKSPVYRDTITLDRTGPELDGIAAALREGAIGSGPASIPIAVSWLARDDIAGLSDAVVSVSCGDGQLQRTEAPGSAAPGQLITWQAAASLFPDASCTITAISKDGVGNSTRASVGGIQARMVPARAANTSVQADQVGIVAQRGPAGGRAAVTVDGTAIALIDLYAPISPGSEVVHVMELESAGPHEISVEATGTSDPASTGSEVEVDGFVTLSASGDAAN